MPTVNYEGNVPKTIRDYADKHADRIVEVTAGYGYNTERGWAYDAFLRSGWCDGSDPLGACHTLIAATAAEMLQQLRDVRPCSCEDCRTAQSSTKETTMYYTIDADYNVIASDAAPEKRDDAITFAFLGEFSAMTAHWQLPQFAAVWNAFAGAPPFGNLRPVKKFENRNIAIKRIWTALEQGFAKNASVPEPTEPTISDDMPTTSKAKAKKQASKRATSPRVAPKAAKATATATAAAGANGTRKDAVLALIGRKGGATLPELMQATGWQKHSVRGFIATLHTKHGVEIASSKNDAGERVYQSGRA